MLNIVGIRFKRAGKVYYFDADDIELEAGDYAVVKTSRGTELGTVVFTPGNAPADETEETLSPVLRKAEPEDIEQAKILNIKISLNYFLKQYGKQKRPKRICGRIININRNRPRRYFKTRLRPDRCVASQASLK